MEIKIEKQYPVAASPQAAWEVLSDIEATAGCMPGASITEQLDDTNYKGKVKSKVGPATMTFNGDLQVLSLDPHTRELKMLGKGKDPTGSSATMELTASVAPGDAADQSELVGHAVIEVSGKLAQFGGRLLMPISDMLLGQFAKNFSDLEAAKTPTEAADAGVADTAPAGSADAGAAIDSASLATSTDAQPAQAPAPEPQKELNALALLWGLIKSWFGKR